MLNLNSRRMRMYAAITIVVVAFLLIPYLKALSLMASRPTNLGVKNGQLAPCPASPNCVCSQAKNKEHGIEPIAFTGDASQAKARIKAALETLPRMKVITEEANYLHVEATSWLFRFVDDVEFYIDEAARVIHVRSASRVGYSDLGANRKRVEQIRAAMNQTAQ